MKMKNVWFYQLVLVSCQFIHSKPPLSSILWIQPSTLLNIPFASLLVSAGSTLLWSKQLVHEK
jgi:hypothetical protein